VVTTTVLLLLLGVGLVAAENITSNFHVNLQFTNASGQIENGTWNLTFNLSRNDNCSDIVYTNNTDVVADSRGIVSVTLQNITGNFSEQLWLCYERNGTLKANHRLAQVPYAFYAANVSAAGVQNTSALNLTGQPGAFTNLSIGDFWLTSANLSFLVSRLLNLSLFVPGNVTNLTHVSNLTNDRNYTNVSALSADLALTNASGGAGGVNTVAVTQGGKTYNPPHLSKDQDIAMGVGDIVRGSTPGGGGFGEENSAVMGPRAIRRTT